MSEISLTLVQQIKTSKIINGMAKVSKKSEKITAFGGIFFVLDKFDHILSSVIDSHLGLRSKLIGYQYSEIIRAVFSVFCCGGDCMEDLNLYLKDVLTGRKGEQLDLFDGEYTYRCILTNDWDMTDEETCLKHALDLSEKFTVFGLHFGPRSKIFFPRTEIREF